MFLTITSTASSATDLGYLLHKHPGKVQSFDLPVGVAHVFYPEATNERCTVALLLEVDPIGLVRGKRFGGNDAFALAQYVNDRPYAASSMVAVAMGKVFRTAMSGRCDARPKLAEQALPLEVHVPALPARGGVDVVERLFGPLGWEVEATPVPLDPTIPAWGDSRYVDLRLRGEMRLADALNHLYVLLPVLDDAKHYWVSPDEVDKLVRAGGGWLVDHPERDLITRRYLAHKRQLVATAVGRLAEVDDAEPESIDNAVPDDTETAEQETPTPLVEWRKRAVVEALKETGSTRVVDVGCGEGALLRVLAHDPFFTEIVGTDVSHRALEIASKRLNLDRMSDHQRERIHVFQSSVTYRDSRLTGYDAVVLMEVIEHVDLTRLRALEQSVFGAAHPSTVVVTTPNVEHNVRYETLAHGSMRHTDHRFEWTRAEFASWAERVAAAHGYSVRFAPVGPVDDEVGPATQMAVFTTGGTA
ncbi:MAG: 3' terminal RNA ribose 2'-O-methyltransferase Hen1 [Candidatus Nanopelagicales bacterium]